MSIFTRSDFWLASAERAIKTAAQTAIATIGTDAVGVTELDWSGIGGVVATATILSVLFSIASGGVSQDGPGIGPEVVARRAIVEQVDSEHGRRADRDGVPDGRDTPEVSVERINDTTTLTTRRYPDGTVEKDFQSDPAS